MRDAPPTIAVLGAAGLIGSALVEGLARAGFPVIAMARRFSAAQTASFGPNAVTRPLAELGADELGDLLRASGADLVVNCLGVLQDGPRGMTTDIHEGFVARLLDAVRRQPKPVLLMHVSVPGREAEDVTAFSRSKRAGERLVAASGLPHVVLRPGFVIAPAAYGGSALVRALAGVPVTLPRRVGERPFAPVAVGDIVDTVSNIARRWADGQRDWAATWDLCADERVSVAGAVDAFRIRFGGPAPLVSMPSGLLRAGAWAGDMAARLGWSPPVRTTALREMMRGVQGDPGPWRAATGLAPTRLAQALARVPTTVQERWFSRLFLLKPAIIAGLSLFWVVSGLIALTVAFQPASAILTDHGFPPGFADAITLVSSVADISVGLAIAWRRSCRVGLWAGIAVSLSYMGAAAILTPALWIEPLGALVKTGPAIVLMAVALAILEDR